MVKISKIKLITLYITYFCVIKYSCFTLQNANAILLSIIKENIAFINEL